MNQEIFNSMQEQMKPSPEVRAALEEKLAQPMKKRPVPWVKYGAIAACAALVIGGFSVYSLRQNPELWILFTHDFHRDYFDATHLHSYVVVDGLAGYAQENAAVENTITGGGSEGGDQDMGMAPDDLAQAMLEVGYTQEEIDEYQSIGYQMTWAKWWKFVGEQQNSEGADPFNLDNLRIFSQKELFVNTGALPGGAYIGDVPSQEEAVNAYQNLMDRFNGTYPDWYGGAYIDNSATLIVCLVEDKDPGDKSLELQVLDWAGGPASRVAFTDVKYSLAYLHGLMDQLNALPEADPVCREVMAGWGVDEEANRIDLTLTQVNDHVLSILAELDRSDDAIYVQVGQRAIADVGTEEPSVQHVAPGGVAVTDDEDLIAVEPYYDGAHYDVEDLPGALPQSKQPATRVQSVPEEDVPARTEDASTAVHGPVSP